MRLRFVTSAQRPGGDDRCSNVYRSPSGCDFSASCNAPSPRVIGPVFSRISRARMDVYCTRDRVRRLGYGNYRPPPPPQTAFFSACGAGGTARIDGAPPSFTRGSFIGFESFDVFDRFTQRVGGVRTAPLKPVHKRCLKIGLIRVHASRPTCTGGWK